MRFDYSFFNIKVHFSIALILGVLLFLSGCNDVNSEKSSECYSNLDVEEISLDFDLAEDETITCCYSDEEIMIFSLGIRNGNQIGPLVNTTRIIVYDLTSKTIRSEYSMDEDAYIYNIIPFKEGIMYSTYDVQTALLDDCTWYVKCLSASEHEILDMGICKTYEKVPTLVLNENIPVYLCQNKDKNNCEVRKIEQEDVCTIAEMDFGLSSNTLIHSNGKNFGFVLIENETISCYVGDLNKVDKVANVNGNLCSFAINENSFICSSVDENGKYSATYINLKNRDVTTEMTKGPLYRLSGSGTSFVAVDHEFSIYGAEEDKNYDFEKIHFSQIELNDNDAAFFFSLGENQFVVEFMDSEGQYQYYMMNL